MKQFKMCSSSRGAPLGRASYGILEDCEPRTISLFEVRLDRGGYDDGGAYWGLRPRGYSIYCARTDDDQYFATVDAMNRDHAALLLEIPPALLKRPLNSVIKFGRYSAQLEHCGHTEPLYRLEEFGQFKHHVPSYADLCSLANAVEGRP